MRLCRCPTSPVSRSYAKIVDATIVVNLERTTIIPVSKLQKCKHNLLYAFGWLQQLIPTNWHNVDVEMREGKDVITGDDYYLEKNKTSDRLLACERTTFFPSSKCITNPS